MQRFEYATHLGFMSDKKLNELGSHGWELVSHSMSSAVGGGPIHQYIFKRKKMKS